MAKIEFISYSGAYPNLCSGILLLRINGQLWAFNYADCMDWDLEGIKAVEDARGKEKVFTCHDKFWDTGGRCYISKKGEEHVEQDSWGLVYENVPPELKDLADDLIAVFNDNVDYGCCGGCL